MAACRWCLSTNLHPLQNTKTLVLCLSQGSDERVMNQSRAPTPKKSQAGPEDVLSLGGPTTASILIPLPSDPPYDLPRSSTPSDFARGIQYIAGAGASARALGTRYLCQRLKSPSAVPGNISGYPKNHTLTCLAHESPCAHRPTTCPELDFWLHQTLPLKPRIHPPFPCSLRPLPPFPYISILCFR